MSAALATLEVTVVPDRSTRPILVDASVQFAYGEVHVIVGPNGAGKSTLFGVLAGDVHPTSGTVLIDGTDLQTLAARDAARRRAVLLQQNTVTFPFTARHVVAMGRAPWARRPEEADDDEAIDAALRDADIAHLAERTLPSLSGGERARVGLARVLAQRTRILLLDEPTAALDLRHQEDVLRIARAQARAGCAVALVLHDLNAAMGIADRVTLLDGGRIVASGAAPEVLTAERIESVYGQRVDVFAHPRTGVPVVTPRR